MFQSLKSDTWRDDKVILCKDCMDWALEICMYDEDRRQWKLIGKRIRFKRRNTKHHVCAYLPMDLLFLFLHAPSENRQLEYRMMCRLLKLLSKGSTQQPGLVSHGAGERSAQRRQHLSSTDCGAQAGFSGTQQHLFFFRQHRHTLRLDPAQVVQKLGIQ
jgi:hypothetical protein